MTGPDPARLRVELPSGPVDVSVDHEPVEDPWAALVIAHGAGAGFRHPFLIGFSRGMRAEGVSTVRFNFAHVEAGRRMPGPASHAVLAWSAVMAYAQAHAPGVPVWAAGKSYGGRMASMAAAEGAIAPRGLVYLGYPLHPPGDPTKSRAAHLPAVVMPQLFVEGTKDPFVDPHAQLEEAVASCRDAQIAWVDGGGHSFEVKGRKRPADEVGAALAPLVAGFLRERS
ncbi:alpha/beta family hydrolase [Microbacterium sp. NPDC064584]|uniref:alpha/beta hydrolase family protein n=1 Tax=Microbacterium sp. NPDC064584 TaxID=3155817 RepID=UPI003448CD24